MKISKITPAEEWVNKIGTTLKMSSNEFRVGFSK